MQPLLTVSFLPRVYRQTILDERRRAITLELMDQIGRRTGGVQAVQAIRRAVPQVFGLDVIGAEAAGSAIDGWLRSNRRDEIVAASHRVNVSRKTGKLASNLHC